MRAVIFDDFGEQPEVREVAEPRPEPGGAVIKVKATGLCRSDWHGWMGHDSDIQALPHVPGHEFAGVVVETGPDVSGWKAGDRVIAPFICACGRCASCAAGDQQVCERQTQPGFNHWGSFAERVAIDNADLNLVQLPDGLEFGTAASLGCRFATSFRAVVDQGRVRAGEWVAVHGCGGVGLSAVMIAAACGARVVAIDISPTALELAAQFGAEVCVDGSSADAAAAVRDLTGGGAHVSLDALGIPVTCLNSIGSLKRRGRHVQLGVMPEPQAVPLGRVMAQELEIIGSHGMAAHAYPRMLGMITSGKLRPHQLVTRQIGLGQTPEALMEMSQGSPAGVTMIVP